MDFKVFPEPDRMSWEMHMTGPDGVYVQGAPRRMEKTRGMAVMGTRCTRETCVCSNTTTNTI